jgi:hypothetical protein
MFSSFSKTLAATAPQMDQMMFDNPSPEVTSRCLAIANKLEEARSLAQQLLSGSQQPRIPQAQQPRLAQAQQPQAQHQHANPANPPMEPLKTQSQLLFKGIPLCSDTQRMRTMEFDDFSRRFGVNPDNQEPSTKKRKRSLCEHGKRRSECKECVGSCEHGYLARRCKACKRASEEAEADAMAGAEAEDDAEDDEDDDDNIEESPVAPETPRKPLSNLIDRLSRKCGNDSMSGLARALDSLKNTQNATDVQNVD